MLPNWHILPVSFNTNQRFTVEYSDTLLVRCIAWSKSVTLIRFVAKNTFRNNRRSMLTALSIGFSMLLLTVMMTIWRSFYIDQLGAESALRLVTRPRVSSMFMLSMPSYYRQKIRSIPGVVDVVPSQLPKYS
jgi:hypothetical protein